MKTKGVITGDIIQAHAIYLSLLYPKTQREIAAQLETTPQSISKRLSAGKESLIRTYLERFEQVVIRQKH